MKSFYRRLLSALMILSLQGCSLFDPAPDSLVYLNEVNLSLDGDANQKSATSIDLLIVYNQALMQVLLGLDAKTYFVKAKQIKQDYPDLADIHHWELTPGQVIREYPIKLRSEEPKGAFMFADYYTPGQHRVRLGSSKVIHVVFKANDFCVLEQGCFGEPNPLMSQEAAVIESNLRFKDLKNADPKRAIAEAEAAKAAAAIKDGAELAKLKAAQAAKFQPQ